MKYSPLLRYYCSTFTVLYLCSFFNNYCCVAEPPELETSNSISANIFLQTLQRSVDMVGERLKSEINDKFNTLSSQLDENERKFSKTLSILEKEWKEKSERLTNLEERQQRAEAAIMRLTKMVHDLENSHNRLRANFEASVAKTPEASSEEELNEVKSTINPTIESIPTEIHVEDIDSDVYTGILVPPTGSATLDPTPYEIQSDGSYRVVGSPNFFKTLEIIPEDEQNEISSIELHYVNVDPEVLMASLQNCSKLKSLRLIKVKFNEELLDAENNRVVLPYLEEFYLDQVGVLSFRNDTVFSKWTEIDDYLKGVDKQHLKSLIFFDKYPEGTWEIDRVSSLGTDIEILTDGVRIFSIKHDDGEITSMLKYTNDFLRHLDPGFLLRKVAISAWRLDLGLLPDSVTHFNLNYVLDSNEVNFSRKLSKFTTLRDLNIFIGNQRHFGWSLAAIPSLQLKNLTIRYSDIAEFPITKILRLDHLYFHLCKFDLAFVQAFPEVFETIHMGVTFRRDNSSSGLHHVFLQKILATPVQWIFMQNFDRNSTRAGIPSVRSFWRMERFLENAGIRQGAENFILENRDGAWSGKELSISELTYWTLQLVGTEKFVTYEAYQKIIQ